MEGTFAVIVPAKVADRFAGLWSEPGQADQMGNTPL